MKLRKDKWDEPQSLAKLFAKERKENSAKLCAELGGTLR